MKLRTKFLALLLVLLCTSSFGRYVGLGTLMESSKCRVFEIDDQGNLSLNDLLTVAYDPVGMAVASNGKIALIASYSYDCPTILEVDKNQNAEVKGMLGLGSGRPTTITPNCKFGIMGILGFYVFEFRQDGEVIYRQFPDYGASYIVALDNLLIGRKSTQSLHLWDITSDGQLIDRGEEVSIAPGWGNYGIYLSLDKHTLLAIDPTNAVVIHIDDNGQVSCDGTTVDTDDCYNPWKVVYTPYYAIIIFDTHGVPVYSLDEESRVEFTGNKYVSPYGGGGFTAAITPDGNYLMLMRMRWSDHQDIAVLRITHDGQLIDIGKNYIIWESYDDIAIIPPQVLFEFGVGEEWEDFTGWSTFDVAPQFTAPLFERLSSGTLGMAAPDNTNTFGSWQSPVDAGMVVPYSLYRLRYELKAWENRLGRLNRLSQFGQLDQLNKQSNRLTENRLTDNRLTMPSLRLRSNAQTFQQGDTLVIPSIGNAEFSPEPGQWTKYDMYFLAPISSCSRPEAQDDVFCSLDIINMDGDDDIGTTIELKQVFMDRIPVDCITTRTLLHEYHFTSGQQGWTNYSLPPQFDAPNFSWQPGKLVMQASSTNCYGSWDSNPGDTLASTAAEVYRATFEVSTDEPDRTKVPDLRFRLSLDDFSLNACQFIGSYGDSEMSPVYDAAYPNRTFKYELYFNKPSSPTPHQLRLSVDLINLSADNTPNATIYIRNVKLEKLELPPFPEDEYF